MARDAHIYWIPLVNAPVFIKMVINNSSKNKASAERSGIIIRVFALHRTIVPCTHHSPPGAPSGPIDPRPPVPLRPRAEESGRVWCEPLIGLLTYKTRILCRRKCKWLWCSGALFLSGLGQGNNDGAIYWRWKSV